MLGRKLRIRRRERLVVGAGMARQVFEKVILSNDLRRVRQVVMGTRGEEAAVAARVARVRGPAGDPVEERWAMNQDWPHAPGPAQDPFLAVAEEAGHEASAMMTD